ncbi:MAG: tetratricopeptide repeat protein [Deltaproteobacteria bacterium]|jgi:tetratricopeptide (TPR) repeat protein|nr:tetratricopeptide repeat protein [Deltaproteobacteria bacterium]
MAYKPQWSLTISAPGSFEEDVGAEMRSRGDFAGAEAAARKALENLVRKRGPGGKGSLPHLDSLGMTLICLERFPEAGEVLEEAVAVSERVMGAFHPDTLTRSSNLGMIHYHAGDRARAADCFRKVRDLKLKFLGPGDRSMLTAEANLAVALAETVPAAETVASFEKILAGIERAYPKDSMKVKLARNNLEQARKLATLS